MLYSFLITSNHASVLLLSLKKRKSVSFRFQPDFFQSSWVKRKIQLRSYKYRIQPSYWSYQWFYWRRKNLKPLILAGGENDSFATGTEHAQFSSSLLLPKEEGFAPLQTITFFIFLLDSVNLPVARPLPNVHFLNEKTDFSFGLIFVELATYHI